LPAYKDEKRNTWYCSFYFTDWTGTKKLKKKRGFNTKREALAWERQFLEVKQADVDMTFGDFWEVYKQDMKVRLRESTMITKTYIVDLKVLPYFKDTPLCDIKATDIREWQNHLMKQGYKETYLKTVNNQLTAMFNYAVKYYELRQNPCSKAGSIGKSRADEMQFWTKEEFEKFIVGVSDKPQSYTAFMVLFWTGMRIGELMALSYQNIDFDNNTISIIKSYQRLNGKDVITPPKTPRSVRTVTMPVFLSEVLKTYVNRLYGLMSYDRIFHFTKYFLEHELMRGVKNTGVKKIRLHDLRHSHASMLIEMGTPILEVRDRLGHEKVETTLNTYGHLYPNKQTELADRLNAMYEGDSL
jgi:integrase